MERCFLTKESDIYSLGVVLFEMMCGRLAILKDHKDEHRTLVSLVKQFYKEGKLDELVFEGIKDKVEWPTAREVVLQLKKALEFQDFEIWEAKLQSDYKEIMRMLKLTDVYSNTSQKDLYHMFSKGILLQDEKVCLSQGSNGEINETVSATKFSYGNHSCHKFQRVVKMMDTPNLKIQIKIKSQFLTPNVIYGAHLVFKFCEPRKLSSQLMYVNLKYQMGRETLHAYFATCGDEWMMIELRRFIPHKKDVDFEVLLESLS
ncbi:putative non-specific serine/threonine protein kinase [Helianthus annuus]|uniref:Non-specific serine/threonine protein kinase n=1 Tax=Helianthus annuus TaxID=4232 RepID=A0A9K3DP41_HELAN|nr:putative non-specific serine/threonine protein kinase [Helianthus annuus]KAJ0437234.1 putative non-specific serine/threonine protein kinase [Helianthus annuus]KAJ0459543.1 putative non-specific serine/threonine protein kinase [Helianthus annuus]